MMSRFAVFGIIAAAASVNCFHISSRVQSRSTIVPYMSTKTGAGFNYDPSNYKDSNSVTYAFQMFYA